MMENSVVAETREYLTTDYMASIELSNRCRDLYNSRLLKAERTKHKLMNPEVGSMRQNDTKRTPMSKAMEKLREEMVR